jgi:hypothetical protein
VATRLKFGVGDGVVVNRRGARNLRGRQGTVIQVGPVKGEYGVEFSDRREPSLIYLEACALDRSTTGIPPGIDGPRGPQRAQDRISRCTD